jgi:alpha-tubulin suppressor-like RCC1 family protein
MTMGLCLLAAFTIGGAAASRASALAVFNGAAAWGYNAGGQLGDGTTTGPETCYPGAVEAGPCSTTPLQVSGLSEVSAISAGGLHSLALLGNGTVMAWGANQFGQMGNGTETGSDVPVAVCAAGTTGPCPTGPFLSGVTAISTGFYHSLALLSNGTVMAWGWNGYRQLGNGTASSNVPVPVSGLTGVVAISATGAGGHHSLALLSDGTVMAWGANSNGQLGHGTTTGLESCFVSNNNYMSCSRTPVSVSGLSEVSAISAGGLHSLALLRDGTVKAWGYDGYGELGNGKEGPEEQSEVPVAVIGLSRVSAVSGGSYHSMALLTDGTVKVWGSDRSLQLGIGETAQTSSDVPVAVGGLSGVTAISGGDRHSLVLLSDGTLMGWGANEYGSLGTGDWSPRYVPTAVSGLSEVAAISAGYVNSLAHGAPSPPVHWYGNGKIIKQGVAAPASTKGALTFLYVAPETKRESAIRCKVKDAETIANPSGGGTGVDELTAFAPSRCSAKSSPCPKGAKPEITARKLPWAAHLSAGSPMREVLGGVELEVNCSGVPLATFTGTLMPAVGSSVLQFGAGSGELTGPGGSKVTVAGTDKLKGPKGATKLTAKSP